MDGKLRNMTAIYLRRGEKILLLYRMGSKVIPDSYTGAAGGHFEQNELNDPKACVLRELYEEIGLEEKDLENLSLRYITLRQKNGETRQNYYFFADLKDGIWENGELPSSNEGRLKWVSEEKIMSLEMPASAKYMMKHYLEVGKDNDLLYAGVTRKEGITFFEMEEF